MVRKSLLLFAVSLFVGGFLACPAPEPSADTPPQPTAGTELHRIQEKCICATCPSWTPECAAKGEKGAYCYSGKTECITEEKGCVCADCPITKEKDLKWGYYCTRGSAKDMMMMEGEKETGGE